MKPEDVKTRLREDTFLGGLSPAMFEGIHRRGRLVHYIKGATIFRRGDEGMSMMLILDGSVKIANSGADGREVVLNFLGPGDVNGEITVLDGLDRTATAIALEPTDAFVIQRRDLLSALQLSPDAMLEIIKGLCGKLRGISILMEDGLHDMQGRTARGLLRLAEQHGRQTTDGIVIGLQLSQRDLGAHMGLSRENMSRQLASLRARGVIDIVDGRIVIRDRLGLEAPASSDRD